MTCRVTGCSLCPHALFSQARSHITKYAIKIGNIMQDTLLTNVTRYLSNIVTVTNLILRNIITKSNEVTNLVSNPLSNA